LLILSASLINLLTDDKSLPKAERKRKQVENAPKKSGQTGLWANAEVEFAQKPVSTIPADRG
jgi:hypothetical protein